MNIFWSVFLGVLAAQVCYTCLYSLARYYITYRVKQAMREAALRAMQQTDGEPNLDHVPGYNRFDN